MSGNVAAPTTVGRIWSAWSRLPARAWLWTMMLCLLWSLGTLILGHGLSQPGHRNWGPAINAICGLQFVGIAVLLAVAVVEDRPVTGGVPWWAYPAAVIAGSVTGSALYWLISQPLLHIATGYHGSAAFEQFVSFVLRKSSYGAASCGLGVLVWVTRRDMIQRRSYLAIAQMRRAEAEQQLLAAQVAAARSRVDPQWLQQQLVEVEADYAQSTALGESRLLALAARLRDAVEAGKLPAEAPRPQAAALAY
jgi:hypothetical protein